MQERFKKNRFRKLVPSSALEPHAGHLTHLLNHHSNSHLRNRDSHRQKSHIPRQHSLEPDSKEEGLAKSIKGGRMRTISSLQEVESDNNKKH